ncbi:hypothetical protein BaRGS_00025801, partial [Batillaria attramentaria]
KETFDINIRCHGNSKSYHGSGIIDSKIAERERPREDPCVCCRQADVDLIVSVTTVYGDR